MLAVAEKWGYISGKKLISGNCKSFLTPSQKGKCEGDTLNADFSLRGYK